MIMGKDKLIVNTDLGSKLNSHFFLRINHDLTVINTFGACRVTCVSL